MPYCYRYSCPGHPEGAAQDSSKKCSCGAPIIFFAIIEESSLLYQIPEPDQRITVP